MEEAGDQERLLKEKKGRKAAKKNKPLELYHVGRDPGQTKNVAAEFCKSRISREPNFGHQTPAEPHNWRNKFRKQKRKADELAARRLLPKNRRRKTQISAKKAENLMSK